MQMPRHREPKMGAMRMLRGPSPGSECLRWMPGGCCKADAQAARARDGCHEDAARPTPRQRDPQMDAMRMLYANAQASRTQDGCHEDAARLMPRQRVPQMDARRMLRGGCPGSEDHRWTPRGCCKADAQAARTKDGCHEDAARPTPRQREPQMDAMRMLQRKCPCSENQGWIP